MKLLLFVFKPVSLCFKPLVLKAINSPGHIIVNKTSTSILRLLKNEIVVPSTDKYVIITRPKT